MRAQKESESFCDYPIFVYLCIVNCVIMLKLVFSKIVENIFGHNKALCLLLCIVAISFTDCRNSRQRDFDRLLVSLAAEDGVVDYNDWQKIVEYISSNASTILDNMSGVFILNIASSMYLLYALFLSPCRFLMNGNTHSCTTVYIF